jgi:hypothetical protein
VFRLRFWWIGALLLSITPAWFLHSRTAFETVMAVSFYAWALYCYLRYRDGAPLMLLPAVVCIALAFYAYSASQLAVVVTAAALALSDARYHWQQRRIVLVAIVLAAIVALPYARFRLQQPDEVYLHLRTLDSYWLKDDLSTMDKLREFLSEYRFGLSPGYWYDPDNSRDLMRHQMRGWGMIWRPTLPLTALGVVICLWRIRQSAHRTVLLALLAAPLGGAMVAVAITRVLLFVVPAALLAALGLDALLGLVARRVRIEVVAVAAFCALAAINVLMFRSALVDGPTWYDNYGLYGMQYGARQVAGAIQEELTDDPNTRVFISPIWTNGGDVVFRFLLDDDPRARFGTTDEFRSAEMPVPEDLIFVVTPEEYEKVAADAVFEEPEVIRVLDYPDGRPGFYFLRLRLSPEAKTIAEQERQERLRPVTETIEVNGEQVSVTRPQFDMGTAAELFDGDTFTLGRTREAHPVVLDITYPAPRALSHLRMVLANDPVQVTAELFTADGRSVARYERSFEAGSGNVHVELPFESAPPGVTRVVITIALARAPRAHLRDRA